MTVCSLDRYDTYERLGKQEADQDRQIHINTLDQAIIGAHFYAHDGDDVSRLSQQNRRIQTQPGYLFAADAISAASPEDPLTLVTTSALTELSQILNELVERDAKNGLPDGSFAKKSKPFR